MNRGSLSIVLIVIFAYVAAGVPPATMKYGDGYFPPGMLSTYYKPHSYFKRPMHKGCLTPKVKYGSYYPTVSGPYCSVNTVVHFSCKQGYHLKGSKTATCMYGGHWNPSHQPVCQMYKIEKKYCPTPAVLLHGSYGPKLDLYHTGSVCRYKCDNGYYMVGHSSSSCTGNGYWSQKPGKCHDIDECKKYVNICGYNAICTNTHGGYECACEVGYTKINGKCKGHSCGVPVLTEYCTYGPSHQKSWDEGQKITFKCPPGYEMHGHGNAACHNGKWTSPSPICKKNNFCYVPVMTKYCTYSPAYQNSWKIGHKITFHCLDGYEMEGHSYATCKSDGTWDNSPPQCYKPKVCYVPVLPEYTTYKPLYKKSWSIGRKIFFYCPSGYDLKGHAYATCGVGGKWDKYPPSCVKRIVCYKPTMPAHCSYKPYYQMTWYIGQKITFDCKTGYKMKGHDYATCRDDGKWDYPPPICYREVCHLPALPEHCSYAPAYQKSWYVGHKISYFCPAGYQVKGYKYATCLYGGKWSHNPPHCHRMVCKPPPLTPYCSYAAGYHKTSYGYGEKVIYKCHSDYIMHGSAYGICKENGYWSATAPRCYKPAYCHAPVLKNNCRLTTPLKAKYSAGHVIGFACPYGFLMKGYKASKCLYNGRWSHPPPLCYRKTYGYNFMHKFW